MGELWYRADTDELVFIDYTYLYGESVDGEFELKWPGTDLQRFGFTYIGEL